MEQGPQDIARTLATILEDRVILCVRLGAGADLPGACRAAARGGLRVLELTWKQHKCRDFMLPVIMNWLVLLWGV